MALLLCLMLLLQHSQGPSLDSALPLINNNNITNNGPYTINQSTMPLPSNVDNNDTTNDGPSIINKTIELDKGRDVFTNERHSPTPLPVPSQPMEPSFTDAFRPNLTVIVGLLSSMLGLSFLVLLYAKHCKRIPMSVYEEERDMPSLRYHLNYYHHYEARGAGGSSGRAPDNARTDSGISPYVVESLPTFSFSALKGMKDGLECAVCLSRYDNADVLRLLPTCKHAFHLACIDLWLLHHSTCPLCRRRVDNDNENDHDLGSISISHSQELEDFLSRYKLWGGRSHEDSDSARIPSSSAWEHWGQISEVGGQSARVSAPPGEPSAWSRIGVPAQHSSLVAGDSARTLESDVNWTHMSVSPAPPRSLAPVPIMMGGDGQLLPGVSTLDSNSSRFSKLGRHSSRASLGSAATHSARALGPGGQLARVPASQCTDIPMVEMLTLEFYLQREVEGVDDDENNGGVSMWCNGGSNSWRKLEDDGVCAEGGSAKKNHMDDGHNDRALVEEGHGKVPKEGSMQRWVVTKGMVMMRRRRMNESWRKGGDKYYDEEVMKRLRHRINIIPHFSSHTIHHHHHHDTHCNDDDDDDVDGCHDTLTMGHHHYGHDIKSCTRNATTRCFSEISCRDQIGSL